MAQVVVRPLAQEDLIEIWLYIAQESEDRADYFLEQFDEKFRLLAEHPFMGRERKELSVRDLRSFPLKKYVIFYLPIESGVQIVRVLHSRQDIEALLG